MIPLPHGCTLNYAITIDIDQLSDDMVEWFEMIGGRVITDKFYDSRGREKTVKYVQYGKGKRCHRNQDGTEGARIHFHGDDAPTASVFLIKFNEHVEKHNMREHYEQNILY